MITFTQAKAAQRGHQQTEDVLKFDSTQMAAHNFMEYLQEHDEDTFFFLLEALLENGDHVEHSPSGCHWLRSAIAPSILQAAKEI